MLLALLGRGVELVVEGSDVVSSSAAWYEALLGLGDDVVEGGGENVSDDFCDDAVVCVIHGDWAGVVDVG